MTSTRPRVATTSPSQSPPPPRCCVEMLTASRSNIRFAATAPTIPPVIWAAISTAVVAAVTAAQGALDQGDHRVEGCRDRLQRDDQRDQRGAGGQAVLQQLQARPPRQARGGDARADDRGDQERGADGLGPRRRGRHRRAAPSALRQAHRVGPPKHRGHVCKHRAGCGSRPTCRACSRSSRPAVCSTLRWWLMVGWERSKASLSSHTHASWSTWAATSAAAAAAGRVGDRLQQRRDPLGLLLGQRHLGQRGAAGDGLERASVPAMTSAWISIDSHLCSSQDGPTHRPTSMSRSTRCPSPSPNSQPGPKPMRRTSSRGSSWPSMSTTSTRPLAFYSALFGSEPPSAAPAMPTSPLPSRR